jgi:C-terminal processing protease CtpA/Prc
MVQPLGDAHIQIERTHGDDFEGYRPGTRYSDGAGGLDDDAVIKSIDDHLTQDLHATNVRKWAGGALLYADLPDGRGYLRSTAFEDWDTKPDNYLGRQALLDQVLDQVFTADHVKNWHGLVIDISYNDGGDDQLGLSIAGRMTDKPYTAYTKLARTDPNDPTKYGRARVVTVQPTPGKPHYTGPVRLITSDLTISAGETFAEALMARTPAATRYGMTTQGVFADNMERKLPNGWTITVGNEDYLAPDGHNYEDIGIPPTTNVPMFTPTQLAAHQDPALDMAGDTR